MFVTYPVCKAALMHGLAWAEAPGPTPIGGPIMSCSKRRIFSDQSQEKQATRTSPRLHGMTWLSMLSCWGLTPEHLPQHGCLTRPQNRGVALDAWNGLRWTSPPDPASSRLQRMPGSVWTG